MDNPGTSDPAGDAALLATYVGGRSSPQGEAAFAALVARHGGMVHRACFRILQDLHLADDAAQAAFLVLARKAGSVRGNEVGAYLHGVAVRTSLCARRSEQRRRRREEEAMVNETHSRQERVDRAAAWSAVAPDLDTAIAALPRMQRAALVLHYCEGLPQTEAADRLGIKAGTLRVHLERALDRLRGRLAGRVAGLTAAGFASLLTEHAAAEGCPSVLVAASSQLAAGGSALPTASGKPLDAHVHHLADGAIRMLFFSKMPLVAAMLSILLALVGGTVAILGQEAHQPAADPPAAHLPTTLYPVEIAGRFGFIDASGKLVVKAAFENAGAFREGRGSVCIDGRWGFIDASGTVVIAPRFRSVKDFVEDLAIVNIDGSFGIIDRNGGMVVAPQFQYADILPNGLVCARTKKNLDQWMDSAGRPLGDASMMFHNARTQTDGLLVISIRDPQAPAGVNPAPRLFGSLDLRTRKGIPPTFSAAQEQFGEGLWAVCQKGKWGFVNRDGAVVIPHSFTYATTFSDGLAIVAKEIDAQGMLTQWMVIDRTGAEVCSLKAPAGQRIFSVGPYACGFALAYLDRGEDVGLKSSPDGSVQIVQPRRPLIKDTRSCGYFARDGGFRPLPDGFDASWGFHHGLAHIAGAGRSALMDPSFTIRTPPEVSGIIMPPDDEAAPAGIVYTVTSDTDGSRPRYGLMDMQGKVILPATLPDRPYRMGDMFRADGAVRYRLVDYQGRQLGESSYEQIGWPVDDLVTVVTEGKLGFLEAATGKIAIPLRFPGTDYDSFGRTGTFSDGLAGVSDGGRYGFIDRKGTWVIRPQFMCVRQAFSSGVAVVSTDGSNSVIIDRTGATIGSGPTQELGRFSDGLAVIGSAGKKQGYVDRTGSEVIPRRFDGAGSFHDGLAMVKEGSRWGVIRQDGKPAWPMPKGAEFGSLICSDGMLAFVLKGRWGFLDTKGAVAIPASFTRVTAFSEGLAFVESVDGAGYIDRNGAFAFRLPKGSLGGAFGGGRAWVMDADCRVAAVDRTGKVVGLPPVGIATLNGFPERHPAGPPASWVFRRAERTISYIDRQGRFVWNPPPLERTGKSGAPAKDPRKDF
jgi:RNA polymerase sigma factor (sigma-70 family)